MQKELNSLLKKLEEISLSNGIEDFKYITTDKIIIGNWVRLKCQYGCSARPRWTCPPYTPTPEEMKKIVSEYSHAILLHLRNITNFDEEKEFNKLVFQLEKHAFLSGYYKAFGMGAGPCMYCEKCTAVGNEKNWDQFHILCKYPKMARPSMEACGIDVFKTAKNLGIELEVITKENQKFPNVGLILLE